MNIHDVRMEAGFSDLKGWGQDETCVNQTQTIAVNIDAPASNPSHMLINSVRRNS